MEFTEYGKMELSLDKFQATDEIKKNVWVVTEKIHGANFSCHTDGTECIFARRRDFLKANEGFYNFRKADFMKDLPEKVNKIFKKVQELITNHEISQVIVFGELFGGSYNHPDVGKVKGKPVQMEIQYCPDLRFCAFDIGYKSKDKNKTTPEQVYLDYSDAMAIFESFDIFYAKPLFTGKVSEALNYPIGFDSTIPKVLGLPDLPKGSNITEGIVARPLRNIMAKDSFGELVRVIVKIKGPEFLETNTNSKKDNKKKGTAITGNRPDKQLIPIMMNFITQNRMVSAVVKTGYPDNEQTEKEIQEEFFQDVMCDMLEEEENQTLWDTCDEKQKQAVNKCLRGKTNALLMKYKAKLVKE